MRRLHLGCVTAVIAGAVTAASAYAQPAKRLADQYIQRVWDTRDGLPQNTVTSIAQTRAQ